VLTIVCWKWRRSDNGYKMPTRISGYTAHHVNTLKSMLKRHCRIPYRLVCLTDDPNGVLCETLPIPTKYAELGGCYRRLWMFSEEARDVLGDRICSIDLDCVIIRDCTKVFSHPGEFVMNTYNAHINVVDQHYNGSLIMFNAGSRRQLWDDFGEHRLRMIEAGRKLRKCIGSDQAWIRMKLGKNEQRLGNRDGIFEARQCRILPPRNASIIFYSGYRDPSLDRREWVRRNWR
jgi:hypothetical protein